jgi:histidinol dehydrogenase
MKKITGFNQAKHLLDRTTAFKTTQTELEIEQNVREIISQVQKDGDIAVASYTCRFDGIKIDNFEVSINEIDRALSSLNPRLLSDLKMSAERIKHYYSTCKQQIKTDLTFDHIRKIIRPLNRVGIYVPGGTASYPSTVLMTAIPAKVAGVNEIIMVTPPRKDGTIPEITLAAARLAGVDRIYKVGGAQAIAALAYGTDSIPRVDKICGPGNIYVATAKKLVYGAVDIDGIQGPSEVIVVADDSASPIHCAADLIAQAEHDEMATSILLTTSPNLASMVEDEIKRQTDRLSRKSIISEALEINGAIVLVNTLDEAIKLVNLFAPEHLLLVVKNAKDYTEKILNAGCVFMGDSSPVVLGDYAAGPSHVLPTGGTARFTSVLSVESFLKQLNFVSLDEAELKKLAPAVIDIAKAEGLDGHANALEVRLKG